jgi:ATP-binding cassette, subfamily F, member 3
MSDPLQKTVESALGPLATELDEDTMQYVVSILEDTEGNTEEDLLETIVPLLEAYTDEDEDVVRGLCESLVKMVLHGVAEKEAAENAAQQTQLEGAVDMSQELERIEAEEAALRATASTKRQMKFQMNVAKVKPVKPKKKPNHHKRLPPAFPVSKMQFRRKNRYGAAKALGSAMHIRDFDLSFGGKTLLDNANMTVVYGRRYGLVGRYVCRAGGRWWWCGGSCICLHFSALRSLLRSCV